MVVVGRCVVVVVGRWVVVVVLGAVRSKISMDVVREIWLHVARQSTRIERVPIAARLGTLTDFANEPPSSTGAVTWASVVPESDHFGAMLTWSQGQ
ncbi:hypothetical protein [Nocardia nepalensis]|uniref:hypothetical protein n=1 Tax=Nocardia nepalensis TaxID=3375448 RepID=UPI003B684A95